METSLIESLLNIAKVTDCPVPFTTNSLSPSVYIYFQLCQHLNLKPFVSEGVIIAGTSQKDNPMWSREQAKAAPPARPEAGVQHPAPSAVPAQHRTKRLITCTALDPIK